MASFFSKISSAEINPSNLVRFEPASTHVANPAASKLACPTFSGSPSSSYFLNDKNIHTVSTAASIPQQSVAFTSKLMPSNGTKNAVPSITASIEHLLNIQPTTPRDRHVVLDHVEVLEAHRSGVPTDALLNHLFQKYEKTDFLSLKPGHQLGDAAYDRTELDLLKDMHLRKSSQATSPSNTHEILEQARKNFILSDAHSETEKNNFNKILDQANKISVGRELIHRFSQLDMQAHVLPGTKDAVNTHHHANNGLQGPVKKMDLQMDLSDATSSPLLTGYGIDGSELQDSRVTIFIHELTHILLAKSQSEKKNRVFAARSNDQLSDAETNQQIFLIEQQNENFAALIQNLAHSELGLPLRHPAYDNELFMHGGIEKQFANIKTSFLANQLKPTLSLAIDLSSGKTRLIERNEAVQRVTPWPDNHKKSSDISYKYRATTTQDLKNYYLDPNRLSTNDHANHGQPVVNLKKNWSAGDVNYLRDYGIPSGTEKNPVATLRRFPNGYSQVDVQLPTGGVLAMHTEYYFEFVQNRHDINTIWLKDETNGQPAALMRLEK